MDGRAKGISLSNFPQTFGGSGYGQSSTILRLDLVGCGGGCGFPRFQESLIMARTQEQQHYKEGHGSLAQIETSTNRLRGANRFGNNLGVSPTNVNLKSSVSAIAIGAGGTILGALVLYFLFKGKIGA
jgi:hypothetical protein